MDEITSLLCIGGALCIGVVSPGPSFIVVAKTAVSAGRTGGLSVAVGMGLGGMLLGVAALLGLNALFLAVPALFIALKFVGGLYLVYLGYCMWRGASQPLDIAVDAAPVHLNFPLRHMLLGVTTQISNPKTAVVYASVFAAFLPTSPSISYSVALVTLVFIMETAWYGIVATSLSRAAPRKTYLRFKKWIDRSAGSVLSALGFKLVTSAGQH